MSAKSYNGLYPFKGWSTIEEASLILSEAMGTKISALDVHNLIAKGSLKLHLYLPNGAEVVGLTLCLKNDVLLAFPPSDLEVLSWQDVTRFPIRVGH